MVDAAARPARLSAARAGLIRLDGFKDALARLSGRPASAFRSKPGFKETCRLVAAAHPDEIGNPRLIATKAGRKTVGYRIEGDADAIRIAHGVASNASMPAWVTGAFPRRVIRLYGLRDGVERPWAKDPIEAARRKGLLDLIYRRWGVSCAVPENPDANWRAALIFPLPGKPTPDYVPTTRGKGLIVASRDGHDVAFLRMPPHRRGRNPADVEAAIAGGLPLPFENAAELRTHLDLNMIHECAGIEERKSVGESTWHRINFIVHRRAIGAITQFRAALPDAVSAHVGLLPIEWSAIDGVAHSFQRRKGWGALHYERCNQALRAMPVLRYALASSERGCFEGTWKAIVAGKPIEAVARIAAGMSDAPALHPKVVRALSGFWPRVRGRIPRGTPVGTTLADVRSMIPALDIYAKADPHRPVPSRGEIQTLYANIQRCRTTVPPVLVAGMLSACRDAKGRIVPLPDDFPDVLHWTWKACEDLSGGRPVSSLAAARILFPPDRRVKGLEKVNDAWHRHVTKHTALVRAIKAKAEKAAIAQVPPEVVAATYPHFLPEPIRFRDVHFMPLRGADLLAREGDEMTHCVGTYVPQASRGQAMIVALSSPEGRSTVEVSVSDWTGTPSLRVMQHQGPGNVEPPTAHVAALRALLRSDKVLKPRDLLDAIEVASSAAARVEAAIERCITEEIGSQIDDATWSFLGAISKGPHRGASMREWFQALA